VQVGIVGSADIWTQAHARLDLLHGRHQTLCEDMEAAAVAQVCARHGVPFLTIKDISNNEYHAPSVLGDGDVDLPWDEVGRRSAALLLRVVERLPS
jgi:nucleoside phosphorylase